MATYSSFKKVTNESIIDGVVSGDDIGTGEVARDQIANDAINSNKLADLQVSSDKLASSIDLSTKTVTYRPIVDGDISSSANIAGAKLSSGSAQTNLGYAPLLTTGGTMTGSLVTTSGSATSPAIRGSDGNTGIYFGTDEVRFTINGSDAMRVTSGARVSFPRKPAFAAVGQPGWLYSNSFGGTGSRELNSVMNWNLAHQYGGSNFNTSNGRFTAPVSGYYHFSTMYYLYNNTNGTNSYIHTFFAKNGTEGTSPSGRIPYNMNMHGNSNNYDDGACYNSIQFLNAGQYVSLYIRWHANGNSRIHAGHQIFSGQLIG